MPENFESLYRWVQPILTGLTLAALIGGYNSIVSLKIEVTRLQERIEMGMGDRFTGSQGEVLRTSIAAMLLKMEDHSKRLYAIESEENSQDDRLKHLENQLKH